jgi:hypothetical protein
MAEHGGAKCSAVLRHFRSADGSYVHDSILLLDICKLHKTDEVRERLMKLQIELIFIPPGMTGASQLPEHAIFGVLSMKAKERFRLEFAYKDAIRVARARIVYGKLVNVMNVMLRLSACEFSVGIRQDAVSWGHRVGLMIGNHRRDWHQLSRFEICGPMAGLPGGASWRAITPPHSGRILAWQDIMSFSSNHGRRMAR